MPPTAALIVWLVSLIILLRWDPAEEGKPSLALWVPLIWIFIVGSRLPAQWLGESVGSAAQSLEEGNPIDRSVFLILIVLSVAILMSRRLDWGKLFARNTALLGFVSFALVSVLWSDSPFISFRRWFRDLGPYLAILVVLSDPRPVEAIRTLVRRLCYLLIPLSILLIKYYPYLGKHYSEWTGAPEFAGATTSKNLLGVMCLVSGLFFFWDTLTRWADRKKRRTKRIIVVDLAFLTMTLWLLNLAHSATSSVCMVVGCMVIVGARSKWGTRHRGLLELLIPASFCVYLIVAFGLDLNGQLAAMLGRDPTLTDRTGIWKLVLSMHTNPLVGTGYESFWLGPRLEQIWKVYGHVTEAHNGYLEIYLNLGLIGVLLLGGLLITSYRNICRQLATSSILAPLNMAFWTIMLFYNMTEAAFKTHLMWDLFLLGAIVVPASAEVRVRDLDPVKETASDARYPRLPIGKDRLGKLPKGTLDQTVRSIPGTDLPSGPPAKPKRLTGAKH
jgi:exopolysaccharide production protein ExoQ